MKWYLEDSLFLNIFVDLTVFYKIFGSVGMVVCEVGDGGWNKICFL